MPKQDLVTRFAHSLATGSLLARDESVAVAVSGGVDSVVMLHLFHAVAQQEDWSIRPQVLHLNHQLRGDQAEADAEYVKKLARQLHFDCTIESVDIHARAEAESVSVELAGRQCRYDFFERTCLKRNLRTIALAHHADDNAETVLHRIVRGTGLRGLAGIRRSRPLREGHDLMVIRPMLGFRRDEIEAYAREHGIEFKHDVSNDSNAHTRNRIRNEVLPMLRNGFNPSVSEALIRLAEQANGLDAYLTETCERMLESLIVEHDDYQLVLHAPSLTRKPRVIRTQLIRQALLRLNVSESELTFGHLNAVADLAAGKAGSKALDLPAGLRVSRRYSRLTFEHARTCALTDVPEVRVATTGVTLLPVRGIEITATIEEVGPDVVAAYLQKRTKAGGESYEEWLDADEVRPPLLGRSRKPGDRFLPLGMSGMKKLSDFFIDEKIDVEARERTVVLCDQLGPIWIVPFRIDQRVRLTRATRRILRLQAKPVS